MTGNLAENVKEINTVVIYQPLQQTPVNNEEENGEELNFKSELREQAV